MRDGPPGAPAAAAPAPPPPPPAPLRTCGRPSAPQPRLRAEPCRCRRRSASLRRSGAAVPPPAPRGRCREEEAAASRGAGGSRWKVAGRGLVPSWEPGTPLPGLHWGREAPRCRAVGAGRLPAISSAGLRVAARLEMRLLSERPGRWAAPRLRPRGSGGGWGRAAGRCPPTKDPSGCAVAGAKVPCLGAGM